MRFYCSVVFDLWRSPQCETDPKDPPRAPRTSMAERAYSVSARGWEMGITEG